MARVVVIGAGVGGLCAAIRLAGAGHAVIVCEASERVGGKLAGSQRTVPAGTFRFDLGPTLLTLPDVFRDLFDATRDPLEDRLTLHRLDPILRYRFADGSQVDTTSDLTYQCAEVAAAFGDIAAAQWLGLLDRGAAIWRAIEKPIFGTPLTTRTALTLAGRLGRPRDVRAVTPWRTLRGVARSTLRDPRLQLMLERYATYEGSDPRRAPAALAVVPYLEQAFGAWSVDGGLHRLAGVLAERARERGARIRLGAAVRQVHVAGGRVEAVSLADGSRLPADVVVSNADAHELYGSLLGRRRAPPADSFSGFVLTLGLRGRTPGLARHTVLFPAGPYDAEFDAVFGRPARPIPDPVIYLHTPTDESTAPAGHEAMYVLVNAPRHGHSGAAGEYDWSDPRTTTRYADHLLDVLARRGIDVRPRVLFRDIRGPADLERDTLAPGGAIYGRVQHGMLSTLRRPANRSRTGGLFLVGGSTHPGGGLPLVALSAKLVAGMIGPA